MVRQTVGLRIQRRVAQLAIPMHHRNRIRRRRSLRREQIRAGSNTAPHAPSRSSPPAPMPLGRRRISRRPSAASGERHRSLKQTHKTLHQSPQRSNRSNRSVAYSSVPASPPGAPSASARLAKAQRQVELRRRRRNRLERRRQRPQAQGPPPRCSGTPASPGTADDATANATGSTPRQDARTARPGGRTPQGSSERTRPTSSRKLGLPDVSVRSTSVLTKNPTRSSSATSRATRDRRADRDVACRHPAAQQRHKPRLHHHEQARSRSPAPSLSSQPCSAAGSDTATVSPRWLATAGRARSAGRSS